MQLLPPFSRYKQFRRPALWRYCGYVFGGRGDGAWHWSIAEASIFVFLAVTAKSMKGGRKKGEKTCRLVTR
jgi:hypothetical protein